MKHNRHVICSNGFSMSVQANKAAYCSPRIDDAERYHKVEVGFPSRDESLLKPYQDDDHEDMTNSVFGYVPASIVNLILVKHGGVVEGELPLGVSIIKPREEW